MVILGDGERLFPEGGHPVDLHLEYCEGNLNLAISMLRGAEVYLRMSGVLSYRVTPQELYVGSWQEEDTVLVPAVPAWPLNRAEEESEFGKFIRRRRFFHLNITDVGVVECYAVSISRR